MLESASQFLNYQEDRYCFLFFAVDNDGTQKRSPQMKVNTRESNTSHSTITTPVRAKKTRLSEKDRASEEHQEFIRAMNEFVAKAGLLSDDPFFGGI